MEKQKYIKASDVAEMFGVTRETIRLWIKKGLLAAIKLDGCNYVTMKSVRTIEDKFADIEVEEIAAYFYLRKLRAANDEYQKSVERLRDCCNWNDAVRVNREQVVKFVPTLFDIVRICRYPSTTRGEAMVSLLLAGKDVKTISEQFGVTPERVKQIMDKELRILQCEATIYTRLKEENESMREQIQTLKNNVASLESAIVDMKIRHTDINIEKVPVDAQENILTKKLVDCFLSVRALNCLKSYSEKINGEWVDKPIETVGELARLHKTDLLKIRNFGKRTLNELDDFLNSIGLKWGTNYIIGENGEITEV